MFQATNESRKMTKTSALRCETLGRAVVLEATGPLKLLSDGVHAVFICAAIYTVKKFT